VARLLACPSCDGRFTFADWSKSACCPHCGARVDFAAAAAGGQDSAGGGTAAETDAGATAAGGGATLRTATAVAGTLEESPAVASRSVATSSSPGREGLHAFGKPLALTKAWLVVFAVWAAAGGLLAVARVEMGRLPVLTTREKAAIGAVEKAHMADGTTFGAALRLVRQANDRLGDLAGQGPLSGLQVDAPAPRWYVIDRPWERTVYVAWELDGPLAGHALSLVWKVHGNVVRAEPSTYAYLQEVVKAAARSPSGATTPVVLPDPSTLETAEPMPSAP
jgi:hypothetical protein